MLEYLEADEKKALIYALEEVKCMKILKDRGYTLGKYKIMPLDDASSSCCVFGNYIVDLFVDTNEFTTKFAGIDKYSYLEDVVNSDVFDEDDLFFEVYLIAPCILKVRALIQEEIFDGDKFYKLIDNIMTVDFDIAESESYYDWKLPPDISEGVLFYMTDSMMVNLYFVKGYLKLKDYCEGVLRGD